MILREVKAYIKQHGQVSFENIFLHFDLSEAAAEAILERLIQQGHVQPIQTKTACQTGQCGGCRQKQTKGAYYQWLDKKLRPIRLDLSLT